MNSAFFLVLRRMRAPIIVLIVIYAISVVGLTLVPGVDAEGKMTAPMSFFHAFYFISYTATTIGFGEIPVAFSDAQRLWVTVCIYLTVVGWSYSVVTLIALLQDKGFQNTLTSNRFTRRVRQLKAPFYLICGCGETGNLVARTFDRIDQAFVVLEKDELRVEELDLQDFKTDTPALAADARQPDNLLLAGLKHPKCRGVLAITNDEEANLAIAIAVRLLNPDIPVIARARTPAVTANMASFGTDHIITPFTQFADHLALAVASPERFRLIELLTSLPETPIPEPHRPPRGHWILCGYGSFGQAVAERLRDTGITLSIIDPAAQDADQNFSGNGTEAGTLRQAGIANASGIVAGSDNDVNNLSIAVTASEINPSLFVVIRQNHAANSALFEAYDADFTVRPSRIVAQESIAILTAPLLARFLDRLHALDEAQCRQLVERLHCECGGLTPVLWDNRLNAAEAPAAWQALMHDSRIRLADLLVDGADRQQRLAVVPLLVERGSDYFLLPADDFVLQAGDQLLFASPLAAQRSLEMTLRNANELDFVLTGHENSGSLLGKLLAAR
ncbi:potassium channel family protein [Ferribacterium limneticum]|uniref:potassium channel family protein n=1 Tax=Ferribacterium limneticum TaxID=76259 RepID=UPI001CFB98CD|nr:potassium channel protein [Ferribacterium limneticum]UCV29033.1 potassium channel protein [Ferribacterium limneticum]UCV32951.1 potassium channel protein [Ferribacterium limneticum]